MQKLIVTIKPIATFKPGKLWLTAVMIEISFRFPNSPSLILRKIFSPAENAPAESDYEMLDKFHEYQEKAEIYHLYHSIQRYTVSNIENGMVSGMLPVPHPVEFAPSKFASSTHYEFFILSLPSPSVDYRTRNKHVLYEVIS